uniref:WD_REPEATS_REGION domain-containing protein n=1 Tax=Steinernema glaseri TaxID=37863 RepID=A0A1I7ZYF8_9BILA
MVFRHHTTQALCGDAHRDFITHVAFDIYGRRIATASSDMTVCVWDSSPSGGEWTRTASWKMHFGPVWRVRWAHPEFGQILATCSFDKTVQIHEEIGNQTPSRLARSGIQVGRGEAPCNWVRRCIFRESPTNVTDIQFAPHYMGLMLATGAKNGVIRIYEAPDIMNLAQWDLVAEIDLITEVMVANGLEAPPTLLQRELSQLQVKDYSAAGAQEQSTKDKEKETTREQKDILLIDLRISSICWSTCRFQRTLLAAATDSEEEKANCVLFLEYVEEKKKFYWLKDLTIKELGPVSEIAFAPSSGRIFHQLAVAIVNEVLIYNIHTTEVHEVVEPEKAVTIGNVRRKPTVIQRMDYKAGLIAGVNSKGVFIWRISWNPTGTILSLGCCDGSVYMWKRHQGNVFKQIAYREPGFSTGERKVPKRHPYY